MPNLAFYQSLPKQDSYSSIYIKGYTEALALVNGVRVVPNAGFVEDLSKDYRDMFDLAGYPCYYIPIKEGVEHFGFILKGKKKVTPHFSLWLNLFNIEAIYEKSPYLFVVEGIKDAYLWLYFKLPVIAMVTSTLSEIVWDEIKKTGKVVVVINDNDETGRLQAPRMLKEARTRGIRCFAYRPKLHKDFGDWFDKPELRDQIGREFRATITIAKQLEAGDASYVHSACQ